MSKRDYEQLEGEISEQRVRLEQRSANRRPFLQKQLELCFEAADAAARLATETDSSEWEIARLKFWRLCWPSLDL
jgi:hypothetical protein